MNVAILIMSVLALALIMVAYFSGEGLHWIGLRAGGKMMWEVLPLLVAAFIIAGMIQVLVPRELISRWLGKEAGLKGIMIGCIAGAITPGGPYVSFPIVAAIYKAGASIGTVVGYVTAWSLWALARAPMEVALIGPRLTLIRFASTLIFPPIAGIIAQMIFAKFT